MTRERVAVHEAVEAGAGVVGVQRDDAVEREIEELALEEDDLGFAGVTPEFAV